MTHLDGVTADDLRDFLAEVEGKRPTQRVMLALNYKEEDITQPALAARYGVSEGTVYNWLSRLDRLGTEPVAEVLYDEKRGPDRGQTRHLSATQSDRFVRALHESPEAVGYDQSAWTTALAKRYIHDAFDVEYCRRHVRRLMTEAGLAPETASSASVTAAKRARDATAKNRHGRTWTAVRS